MTLPGDDDGVVGSAQLDTPAHGVAAPGGDLLDVRQIGTHAAHALEDGVADELGVLAAGVLVGDDQNIGQAGAHLTQHGPLALVPVAVGSEDHDEAPRGDGAHGLEGQLHGLGGVGEVDDAQATSTVALADALHAAGDVVGTGQGGGGRGGGHPCTDGHDQGQGGVLDVDEPGQGTGGLDLLAVGPVEGEGGGGVGQGDGGVADPPVGGSLTGVGAHAVDLDGGLGGQGRPPLVVDADHAAAGVLGGEQLRLGLQVALHGLVEVEVVALEVGEAGNVDDNPIEPVQDDGVAGGLQGGGADLVLHGQGHHPLQDGGLDGGARGLHGALPHAQLDGSGHHAAADVSGQNGVEEVGGGRLAVGSGDGGSDQSACRVVVDLGAQGADDGTGVIVHEDRRTRSGLVDDLGAVGIGQDGNGTGGDGLGGEVGPVDGETGQSHEELARCDVAGVDADPQGAQVVEGGGILS